MFTVILYVFGLCAVFYILTKVCDQYFVRSLDILARQFRLRDDVTGATFMAIGTSAPEFFICMIAVLRVGAEAVGAGTILGSAIFNILVIIGASAMIAPVRSYLHWQPVVRDMLFYFSAVMLVALTFMDSRITLTEALAYMATYAAYLILLSRWNQWFPHGSDTGLQDVQRGLCRSEAYVEHRRAFWSRVLSPMDRILTLAFPNLDKRPGLYPLTLILCVTYIVGLSWLLVDLGVGLARALSIPPVIIALTVLACGTSIADLVASLIVARRGRMDMAVSNAFGSNIFDILLCLGIPWAFAIITTGRAITITTAHLFSTILLLFFTLVTSLFVMAAQEFHLGKRGGHLLLLLYAMYLFYMWYGASYPEVLETRTLLRGIGVDPGP